MSKVIGYRRVSTVDQKLDRQLAGVEMDKVFDDKCTGSTTKRPGLERCVEYLRDGDTLVVHSIDRLARNMEDLLKLVKTLNQRDVTVRFIKENLTFTPDKDASPMETFQFHMLSAFAEFERSMIRERQREGIQKAREKGKKFGRAPVDPEIVKRVRELSQSGSTVAAIAAETGLGTSTVYRLRKPA